MHHEPRPCDIGVGLGSHDLGVAIHAADLFHCGLFPRIVFTGANAPTTVERFPRGEAVHYREHALELGVPDGAILVEPNARNTGENIEFTRKLLADDGIEVRSLILISRPYQQRRAYATCKKLWPEVEVICSSRPLPLADYIRSIGDTKRVVDMLVGDTQRITVYAERGFAIHQDVPDNVHAAYERLVAAGYTSRLI
ncbi:YdcF family protein [Streptoalloteichus hindustanus]|nr:YdcF family protein [Streptoalloteichus hindustanus]